MKRSHLLTTLSALLFLFQSAVAQDILTINHSCSFEGEETNEELYVFNASNEAEQIVGKIVNAFSLSKNFIVKSADCKNALATTEGRQRYILYNTSFLEDFKKDAKTKWAAYCVMAHEIGHHLNNHDFEVNDKKKRKIMELEADKFAGGVLFILGATLDESKAGIDLLQSKGESDTHPPARARAEAIANGWKNSQEHHRSVTRVEPEAPPIEEQKTITREPEKKKTSPEKKYKEPYERPEVKKEEEEVDWSRVSDLMLAQQVVGFWQNSYYNAYGGYVVNKSAVYANGTMQIDTYTNGIFTAQYIGSWGVENGEFVQWNQAGVINRYRIDVYNANTISYTFTQTNGVYLVPAGTVFTYYRTY